MALGASDELLEDVRQRRDAEHDGYESEQAVGPVPDV